MTTTNDASTKAPGDEAGIATQPTRPPCECGCGVFPGGKKSRFLPGHDAKLASAHKKAAAEAAPSPSVAVNAQDRPSRPARRSPGKDDASGVDGKNSARPRASRKARGAR